MNKHESDPEIKRLVLYALKARTVFWPPEHQITEADANYILFRFYHDQDARPITVMPTTVSHPMENPEWEDALNQMVFDHPPVTKFQAKMVGDRLVFSAIEPEEDK